MNDLSAFDGDGECDRQICDLRVKGKSEAEVCTMLGSRFLTFTGRWTVRRKRR
jgi:hypothetical protein